MVFVHLVEKAQHMTIAQFGRTTRQLAFAMGLVLLSVTMSEAQCFSTGKDPVLTSVFDYLLAFSEALSDAKSAESRNPDNVTDDVKIMVGLRQARSDYKCAESRVSAFQKSKIEAIATSALGATFSFSSIADVQERRSKHLANSLNEVSAGTFKPGTAAEISAEITTKGDEAGQMLIQAAIAAGLASVAKDPATGLMSRLAMNASERDQVLAKLRSTFGSEVTKGVQAGQSRLLGCAALIYGVVGDPKRLPQQ